MAGPIDFAKVGLFGLWLDKRFFNVDRFVDTLGTVPADLVKAGFKLIKPTMDLSTNLNLWWNLWNDKYVEGFNALNKWANEYVAFPGRVLPPVGARLLPGQQALPGRAGPRGPPRPARAPSPVRSSWWAPRRTTSPRRTCVRALIDVVGSRDKEYVELPGGHISLIAGRGAALHCWPKVSAGCRSCRPMLPQSVMYAAAKVTMTETSPSQQLFEMWKRQLEEGAKSWAQLMTKGAAPAPPIPPDSGGSPCSSRDSPSGRASSPRPRSPPT